MSRIVPPEFAPENCMLSTIWNCKAIMNISSIHPQTNPCLMVVFMFQSNTIANNPIPLQRLKMSDN